MPRLLISILFTLLVLPFLLYSQQSDWIQQSPPSIGYDVNDVHMFNSTTALAVGSGGRIIKTSDGGTTWTSVSSGTSNSLYRIFFVDQSTGWVIGSDGTIRKSTDGGTTWNAQTSGVGSYVSLTAIHFVDASTGWLIATDDKIRKTTDGGTTWVVQYTVTGTYVSLEDVYFFNTNVGLVLGYSMGNGEVFRTTDGGQTWSSVDMSNSWFKKVFFINDQIGWAAGITATTISYTTPDPFGGGGGLSIYGQRSTVWKTTDGGATWAGGVFPTSYWLMNAYFSDVLSGWLIGGNGQIFKTTDGGSNWVSQTSPLGTAHTLKSIQFIGSTGWIVGTGGEILRTTNSGSTWSFQSGGGTTNGIQALFFLDSLTGWAAATGGVTLKTTDGGAVWKPQQSGYTWFAFLSIHFVSSSIGWAVGESGKIMKSTDGGSTWIYQSCPVSSHLSSVRIFDAQTGWIVGAAGVILRTTNGGTNWTSMASGTTSRINAVAVLSASTAIAVADTGIILMTTNSGSSWNRIPSGTTNDLNAICFLNQSSGWIGGDAGTILRTSDGGVSWTLWSRPFSSDFASMQFVDASTGWAVVRYYGIYKTINGGVTWAKQNTGSTGTLNHAFFVNASIGWVAGDGGYILKTTNGGGPASFAPAPVSPGNRSLGVSSSLSLTWDACPGATSYRLQVSTSPTFSTYPEALTVDASGLTGATYTLSNLSLNRVFYWRVKAVYPSGESDWSPTSSFATSGTNWFAQISSTSYNLSSVCFIDAQKGWAVGGYNTFLQTSDGGATWNSQYQSTYASWNSIFFLNSTTGWVAGDYGKIINTTNGGSVWSAQSSGTTNDLCSIRFVDGSTGFTVGDAGVILKTMNGGTTWSPLSSGITDKNLLSASFVNSSKGWVVGTQGVIMFTSDGGSTWSPQRSGTTKSLRSVYSLDALNVWVVGDEGTILKTSNGGVTWTPAASGSSAHLYGMHFLDSQTGWIVGDNGALLKTTDGGSSWGAQNSETTTSMYSLAAANSTTAWIVGASGTILKSTNGGGTVLYPPSLASPAAKSTDLTSELTLAWNSRPQAISYQVQVATDPSFASSTIVTDKSGLIGNSYGLSGLEANKVYFWHVRITYAEGTSLWSQTWNFATGGKNWKAQIVPTTQSLESVFFIDASNGWVVGGSGSIMKTTDGGNTWTDQSYQTGERLYSVWFINTTTGWAAGGKGTILRTTDGGVQWTAQTSGTTNDLYGIRFTDASTGWAIGNWGTILKTVNGGASWGLQTSGTSNPLNSAHFFNQQIGWVASYNSILKTTDGGVTWKSTQPNGLSYTLRGIHFIDSTFGCAVGAYGIYVRTTNGGATWTSHQSGVSEYLYSVYFASASVGWVVGMGGTILKTTDGGVNWGQLSAETSTDFSCVSFVDPSTGWVVGASGAVLKTTSGGGFPLSKPVLFSPYHYSYDIVSNPTLRWLRTPGSTSYRLQVSEYSSFSSTVVDKSAITDTSYALSGLKLNASYYWRVNATSPSGTSGWSSVWTFMVGNGTPMVPALLSPQNFSSGVPISPMLSWQTSEGATSYRLQVSTSSSFGPLVFDDSTLTITTQQVGPFSPNTLYYWRVNAKNSYGSGNWSSVWTFTTSSTAGAPSAPSLFSPSNNNTGVSLTPTLVWNSSTGAVTYRLQVALNQTFTAVVFDDSTVSATSQTVGPLEGNTFHYWRVSAKNTYGASAWSSTWMFTTQSAGGGIPAAPALLRPSNNAIGVSTNPVIRWIASSGAAAYHLQVSTTPTFTAIVFDDSTLTVPEKKIGPLTRNSVYYWHVRGRNSAGTSDWSPVWSFTTVSVGPAGPELFSPSQYASGVGTSMVLRWMSSDGAASYRVQVSTNSSFSANLIDNTLTDTSYSVSTLSASTSYYWRVRAIDANGAGNWSEVWSFATIGAGWSTTSVSGYFRSICFVGSQRGWMAGTSGILATTDGGASWKTQTSGVFSLESISFIDSLTGWSVGAAGKILKTTDGGTQWTSQTSGSAVDFRGVSMSDANNGWVVSAGMILRTTNGGSSWQSQTAPVMEYIYGVKALSSTKGIVFGGNLILRTTNGGALWTSQPLPTYGFFQGAHFIDENTGWVVGAYGVMFKTSNGGAEWSVVSSATSNWITSIYFIDAQRGWAVGWKGTIIKTTDGGASWGRQISGITSSLYGVHFIDAFNGWAVGGKNMKTSDGGGVSFFPPALLSPSAGATNTSTRPTFQWDAAVGVVSYQLQVATGSSFYSFEMIVNDSALTSTYRQTSPLSPNRKYYWRVLGYLIDGTDLCSPVWSFTTGTSSTSVDNIAGLPGEYYLYQNYPNPFNPSTSIQFDIPRESYVTLKIYSALGIEVETLVASLLSPGRYRVVWNAANLSSSVYFCRLRAGEFMAVKKLILLR